MFDVVIVGAGMVGSALGLELARGGLRVALVDAGSGEAAWSPDTVDNRVSAITEASRLWLKRLGVWDAIASRRISGYEHMTVWDGEGTGELGFHADDISVDTLGHIVENSAITDALHDALRDCDEATLLFGCRAEALVCDDAAAGILHLDDGRQLTAGLIVGADGARSRLRALAGIETREYATGQVALVATVTHERSHDATARQVFLPTGPLAFLPLSVSGNTHTSSIVWSCDEAFGHVQNERNDDDFLRELSVAFEHRLGSFHTVQSRACFPLVQRHAVRYTQAGLALVGDAAHNIHPLAGQGVNLGFLDAAVLAEEVLQARKRGIAMGDARILARYSRRRRGDNQQMLWMMDAFRRGFGSRLTPVRLLRNLGLQGVNRMAPIKQFFARQALGRRGDLPRVMKP
ncbi:UbiH/UbiF/VisC/COQ6 family ubiquinone biosynthesis hydroxylase [Larsenimonas rhizosphaerae]|uniref:UbiH/UbiF/VisC/COQ6 family ubiquinone biosynthesis hydroxylase n=1 Tax=Larsenimonas rhizosphaerae TaxID=2944682 RepID=UPI0020334A0C|nr:UbiH/UbiF/VisC/COQ6 family ubiquinone biosynthesis hydroxylase [Larsenimonas rhizosphaerae]MCM2129336.1 UbiH/UbiF/VisC/COQ6 family ubiquinone biosynthesis hydroxylase [Larsenimonas rhizosphaerae]